MTTYEPSDVKRYYTTAALVSAAIAGALVIYAAIAEILRLAVNYAPPMAGTAAAATIRPVLYVMAFASVGVARIVPAKIAEARKPEDPASLAAALTQASISRTALYEVPGVLGLVGWLIAGFYPDLYVLLGLSFVLVVKNFPRLSDWEKEFAGRFGAVISGQPGTK